MNVIIGNNEITEINQQNVITYTKSVKNEYSVMLSNIKNFKINKKRVNILLIVSTIKNIQ